LVFSFQASFGGPIPAVGLGAVRRAAAHAQLRPFSQSNATCGHCRRPPDRQVQGTMLDYEYIARTMSPTILHQPLAAS